MNIYLTRYLHPDGTLYTGPEILAANEGEARFQLFDKEFDSYRCIEIVGRLSGKQSWLGKRNENKMEQFNIGQA